MGVKTGVFLMKKYLFVVVNTLLAGLSLLVISFYITPKKVLVFNGSSASTIDVYLGAECVKRDLKTQEAFEVKVPRPLNPYTPVSIWVKGFATSEGKKVPVFQFMGTADENAGNVRNMSFKDLPASWTVGELMGTW